MLDFYNTVIKPKNDALGASLNSYPALTPAFPKSLRRRISKIDKRTAYNIKQIRKGIK